MKNQIITMRRMTALMAVLAAMTILAGCLYPQDRLAQNQVTPRDAVRQVQEAVDQFMADRSVLPIKNADMDTPAYEKFVIDFGKLQRSGYLPDLPAAAYERGGSYYFLVQNEEEQPLVRLMNIVVYQQMNDLQKRVDEWRESNGGVLPAGEPIYPAFAALDFERLGGSKPDIRSVFSGHPANILIHENGQLYVDYGIDVRQAVEKLGAAPAPDEDLRELLVRESLYVPVKAPAYYWEAGEPSARLP